MADSPVWLDFLLRSVALLEAKQIVSIALIVAAPVRGLQGPTRRHSPLPY
jgi:hypothetical protein